MKSILLASFLFFSIATFAQVGIGTATPDGSANLDVTSTTKGFLPPRLTTTQRNNINSPAAGLIVYNTTLGEIQFYNGTSWITASSILFDSSSLSNRINTKLNLADTSDMLFNYKVGLNNKLNKTDTTNMLSNYLRKSDTASLSNRINTINTGLNNKLNKEDTASLSNRIYAKLDKTDTASLSNRINTINIGLNNKLNKTDTASLSERINTKLNSSVIDLGNQTGVIIYWDENLYKFRTLAPGTAGQVLKMSSGNNPVPVWGTDATTSIPAFSPCGATISDIDGNIYNTVLIGAQCWTKENLRVRRYNNGTAIQFNATGGSGGPSATWQNLTIGAHTIYANDSTNTPSNRTKYGYLYNWYAAKGIYTTGNIVSIDTLNVCPVGWHVPSDTEWSTLTTELGGESGAGGMMKSKGTAYWNSPNTGATNESGFSALPGGVRLSDGSFNAVTSNAYLWSSMELNNSNAWIRTLSSNDGSVIRVTNNKQVGASIRCIKN